ncbi:putative addiction module antidote protein [Pantoea coffeiphila]|nr:putative addiction module antidote protein [Pantoea coffeiphila]
MQLDTCKTIKRGQKMTANTKADAVSTQDTQNFPPTVDRDALFIEELRADPSYAEIYLQTALEDIYEEGGVSAFLTALRRVVEARGGVGEISRRSGLARQNIYRALSNEGNPTIKTLTEITRAAGIRLTPNRP